MKTFDQYLEATPSPLPDPLGDAMKHLAALEGIIRDQKRNSYERSDLFSTNLKVFNEIIRTLEYGLKDESKLKEAVAKAIQLAETGSENRAHHFSSWNKLSKSGN